MGIILAVAIGVIVAVAAIVIAEDYARRRR